MFQRTTSELHVTVLGLGAMGYAMATNLLKKGMQVTGFDVSQTALERFVNAGGYSASTLQEAVSSADFVVVMVTNATQVT
jgi:3-hydroxyisobutyrate dehydrogenase